MSESKEIPYGTRVKYNSLTGTVIDPDEPGRGQPSRGYRPPYDAVWMYLDSIHHSRTDGMVGVNIGPKHGFWVKVDDPALELLPFEDLEKIDYHRFRTGQLVRLTQRDGGVETIQTGVVTVEGGSVRLGDKDRFGNRIWVDWDYLDSMEVLKEP